MWGNPESSTSTLQESFVLGHILSNAYVWLCMTVLMWFWVWIIRRYYESFFLFWGKDIAKTLNQSFSTSTIFLTKIKFHYFMDQNDKLEGNENIYFKFVIKINFPMRIQKNIFSPDLLIISFVLYVYKCSLGVNRLIVRVFT